MRVMEIPQFPNKIEIPDFDNLVRTRLSQTMVMWPDQAIPLLGYMCHPNDPLARDALTNTLWSWMNQSETARPAIPGKLGRIQANWMRVADVFNLHSDMVAGQHQARRGGPSIGKAITLTATNAKSRGTSEATLWKLWSTYKDVAHLVTAATAIRDDARIRYRQEPFGPFGIDYQQFLPFQMALMMPDFVLAVGLEFQRIGLTFVPHGRTEPELNPETVWRIPPDINVVACPHPVRKIRLQDTVVLNNRRAGNRGRANAYETTPVFD